jgi:hypothetical protein
LGAVSTAEAVQDLQLALEKMLVDYSRPRGAVVYLWKHPGVPIAKSTGCQQLLAASGICNPLVHKVVHVAKGEFHE